jgi:hypothetical protein
MSSFGLSRRYALIIIPFNAFAHNLTTDTQLSCLRTCREHLQPGGLLAFDGAFPGTIGLARRLAAACWRRDFPSRNGLARAMWDTRTFDRVQQLQYSYNEIEMLDANGKIMATHPSKTTVRWTYKPEMELLLRGSGLARWEIWGFRRKTLEQETDAMIVKAWANH